MTHHTPDDLQHAGAAGRVFGAIFGLVFAGGGLAFLGAILTSPAPIFFKLFGSCISLGIVSAGAFVSFAAATGRGTRRGRGWTDSATDSIAQGTHSYACPNCGSTLASAADVSPHGDAKCTYCDRWFNIHQPA